MNIYLTKQTSKKNPDRPYFELFTLNEKTQRLHITYDFNIINKLVPRDIRASLPVGEYIKL